MVPRSEVEVATPIPSLLGRRPLSRRGLARAAGTTARRPRTAADRHRKWILLGLLGLLEVGVRTGLLDAMVLVEPSSVATAAVDLAGDGEVRAAFVDVARMTTIAVALGSAVGVVVGGLMGLHDGLHRVVHPLASVLFSTPKMIFIPLLILVMGSGTSAKVTYGAVGAALPVVITVAAGVRAVDRHLLEAARSMGASRRQAVRLVLLPGATPAVFTGIWYGIQHALLGVLVMELFSSNRGVGYFITLYTSTLRMDRTYALVVSLSLFAIGLAALWRRLERRAMRWNPEVR